MSTSGTSGERVPIVASLCGSLLAASSESTGDNGGRGGGLLQVLALEGGFVLQNVLHHTMDVTCIDVSHSGGDGDASCWPQVRTFLYQFGIYQNMRKCIQFTLGSYQWYSKIFTLFSECVKVFTL